MVDVPSVQLQLAGHHTREGTKVAGGDALPFITTTSKRPSNLVRQASLQPQRLCCAGEVCEFLYDSGPAYDDDSSANGLFRDALSQWHHGWTIRTDAPVSFQSPTACLGRNGRSSRGIHAPIGPGVFPPHLPVPQA
jgi:hypothetical protein